MILFLYLHYTEKKKNLAHCITSGQETNKLVVYIEFSVFIYSALHKRQFSYKDLNVLRKFSGK